MTATNEELMAWMIAFQLLVLAAPCAYLSYKLMADNLKFNEWMNRAIRSWKPAS